MKKVLKFLIYLLPWFISGVIFRIDTSFYDTIKKPFFAPTGILFVIIWPILYLTIAYSLYKNENKNMSYYKSLIINYVSNQIYTFLFFIIKSPFISLVDTIICFISSLFLYNEVKNKLLLPYIIWNLYAVILSFSIYFLNL